MTRLRPNAFTLPGYVPPDDALSDSPPVEIDALDMNPWRDEVMEGYPDLYEPLNMTYNPPMGHHVTNNPDDDRRAQVWLSPDYEFQRAPYTIIGQAYSFPLVTGALHTAYADICVWDSENETCFKKPPEGTEMPTYVMPRPSQLVLVQNPEGESVPGDGGTGGGGGTNGSWEEVHWMTLSATWFGPLTIEGQGASSSSAGTEIPHPKGVLSSMDSGENLDQLRQRLTWKLIEPANRPDLLVIEEAHVGTAPFQRVIPIARLNVGAGEMFEVELAVEGEEGDRLVLDRISISTKDPLLVPNYDRNDQIDATDHRRAVAEDVLYFWVNDNFDQSVIKKAGKQNDIPCQLYSREWTPYGDGICVAQYFVNWANDHVDSVRDLLDFFPVWVNIERMLARFPVATHQYILKQADGALNAVIFPKVRCSDVASYLKKPSVANSLKQAEVVQISPDGYLLPEAFLTQNADQRVILFEGRKTTEHPLVLEIRSKANPNESLTEDMPLQILNVEEMFRYKNLRPESQKMYDDRLTTQLPPEFFDNMTFVHVHGFQAKEEGLRGTSSTVFKRLWQTGYTGQFWYVSWDSEALHLFKGHYHNAAVNAFAYANTLATFLQGLTGPVDVGAFSLGNLLTSLAIADHNAPVRHYYAMEAAVALEAYGTEFDAKGLPNPMYDDDRPYLISPEKFEGTGESYPWQAYAEEVYASEWHRLFADDPNDERRNVTWRNRLRLVQSKAKAVYNFYSSTEDVLGISRDPKGIRTLFQHPWTGNFIFYVWQVQELLKGLEILINIGGGSDPYAGWGFTTSLPHLESVPIFDPSTGKILFFKNILTTPDVVKAKLASSTECAAFLALLKTDPLFRPDPEILFTTTEGADFVKGQVKDYVNELNYGKGESQTSGRTGGLKW
ncbi:hypothetical protein U27_05157 [Candidatus Vecturithrix granuli]|uniref:Uncharacterized protein n=1 Tax=Vecturithrix granuli TaxID=1499967 RepID=A0A081C0S9_VECG1|nr:hypothetical protein U27_05157 [Candidatus Vecturithrix granuli]